MIGGEAVRAVIVGVFVLDAGPPGEAALWPELVSEMPLAGVATGVAVGLEQLGDGGGAGGKRDVVVQCTVGVGIETGEHGGAGGGAEWLSAVRAIEDDAARREAIQVGRAPAQGRAGM